MAVNNSLTKSAPQKRLGMTAYLNQDAVKQQITSIVGSKRGTSFITSIVSAVQANPGLQECTNPSILSAALLGESLNLSPSASLGQYWIIPFNNKKKGVKEAQFQLGANGYKQLAMRTGQYKDIDFLEIHEGEYKGRDKFTGKQVFEFIEDDDEREALPVVGYMAYFELLNGFRKSVYWTKTKMENHANQYSQAFNLEAYRKLQNFRHVKCGSILHTGIRILQGWQKRHLSSTFCQNGEFYQLNLSRQWMLIWLLSMKMAQRIMLKMSRMSLIWNR